MAGDLLHFLQVERHRPHPPTSRRPSSHFCGTGHRLHPPPPVRGGGHPPRIELRQRRDRGRGRAAARSRYPLCVAARSWIPGGTCTQQRPSPVPRGSRSCPWTVTSSYHPTLRSHFALHDGSRKVVCGRRRHVLPGVCDSDQYDEKVATRSRGAQLRRRTLLRPSGARGRIHGCRSTASPSVRHGVITCSSMKKWKVGEAKYRELALRLFHRNGYRFVLPTDLEPLFHLLSPGFSAHHEKIVSGIKNSFT